MQLPSSVHTRQGLSPVYKTGWVATLHPRFCPATPTCSKDLNNPHLYSQRALLNIMAPPFTARLGSRDLSQTATSSTKPPTSEQLVGQWYMTASSSSFWQDRKHSACLTYQVSAATPGALDDVTTFFSDGSVQPSSTKGVSSPSAAGAGIYDWRGSGWLRMIRTSWEVVGWGVLGNDEGDDELVLVTLAQKTMFSPPALSVYWRKKDGMGAERIQAVSAALKALGDANLALDVDRLRVVPQTGLAERETRV